MGNKSGIWRFYRRVWKNIFYERRDKERKRGVWENRLGVRDRIIQFRIERIIAFVAQILQNTLFLL